MLSSQHAKEKADNRHMLYKILSNVRFLARQGLPLIMYAQVVVLVTLVLVMPAINATSERSFSCLQRIISYLQSTMTQLRLNSTMVLHVHKDLTDNLNLIEVANDFVANKKEHRSKVFGLFKQNEFQKLAVCTSCGKASKCIYCT